MSDQNFWRSEHEAMSSTEAAVSYTRGLIEKEMQGTGDLEPALYRLEAKTGIGFWTLRGLWYGRRKIIDRDLFNRVRGAYLSLCERKVTALQTELALEQARSGDATFENLARKIDLLAQEVRAAQENLTLNPEAAE